MGRTQSGQARYRPHRALGKRNVASGAALGYALQASWARSVDPRLCAGARQMFPYCSHSTHPTMAATADGVSRV
jgi:hypothetical protein